MEISKNQRLKDIVYRHVRDSIVSFKLEPGSRLLEEEVAKALGVSRTPVREAFGTLALEGFIEILPRRGAIIKDVTLKDLQDTLIVREELEILAIKLATPSINDEVLEKLKEAKEKFEEAVEAFDVLKMIEEDTKFHDIIFNCTKNEKLINVLNYLKEQLYRYRAIYIREKASLIEIVEDHNEIYKSLAKKDSERAKKAISKHIKNQEKSLTIQFIAKGGKT